MSRLTRAACYAILLMPVVGHVQEDEREVDPKYTWDLSEIYPDLESWEKARNEVLGSFEEIEARRGNLGKSADDLYETLALISDTSRKAARVSTYAGLNADENLRVTETQERRQLGQIMFSRFNEATAWMQPEILRVGEEVINAYLNEDERLERFRFQLDDSLRNAPHTLGDEAEETLAFFSQAMASPTATRGSTRSTNDCSSV